MIILFLRDRSVSHKYKIVDYCLHKKDMRCMMNRVENKIVDIDGYVHVVNGKVICFEPGVYDLNNPEDVDALVLLADDMSGEDTRFLPAGNDTILFVDKGEHDRELIMTIGDLRGMPDECQRKVDRIRNEIM